VCFRVLEKCWRLHKSLAAGLLQLAARRRDRQQRKRSDSTPPKMNPSTPLKRVRSEVHGAEWIERPHVAASKLENEVGPHEEVASAVIEGVMGETITGTDTKRVLSSSCINPGFGAPLALQTPLASPLQTPLASPLQTPLASPLQTPLASPLQTPLASPLQTPLASPLQIAPSSTNVTKFAAHAASSTCRTVVADSVVLPMSAGEFFAFYLADGAPYSSSRFQERKQERDITTSMWDGGGLADEMGIVQLRRTVSFYRPINQFGIEGTVMHKKQSLKVYDDWGLVMDSISVLDKKSLVPAAACFGVHDSLVVRECPQGVELSVSFDVRFYTSSVLRYFVETQTTRETLVYLKTYLDFIRENAQSSFPALDDEASHLANKVNLIPDQGIDQDVHVRFDERGIATQRAVGKSWSERQKSSVRWLLLCLALLAAVDLLSSSGVFSYLRSLFP
jgi:hypothetical protein